MATIHASLVTPERLVFEAEVQAVMLRTDFGEAAFFPGHTPLIGALVPGVVRFQREDGTEEKAAVHGGFVQVDGEHVVVLAPMAELAEEIDVERARRAADSAEAAGSSSAGHTEDGADVPHDDALARAQLRLEVAGA
jgi:F-type H+-transporting ATPase subunit epsilon